MEIKIDEINLNQIEFKFSLGTISESRIVYSVSAKDFVLVGHQLDVSEKTYSAIMDLVSALKEDIQNSLGISSESTKVENPIEGL